MTVILGWMWIETVLAVWLWISYRHFKTACHKAESALRDHHIADTKARSERLQQSIDDLHTRTEQDPTERKTA
ncbi:MAG: hypothetical protein JWN52_8074 [Actinomycetia bacterium]|nr:hypothetical protein [Actinomycetes bacterium]